MREKTIKNGIVEERLIDFVRLKTKNVKHQNINHHIRQIWLILTFSYS